MKIRFKYRKTWWWRFVHYNYFHKQLFRKYYVRRRSALTEKEIKKYQRY